CLVVVPILDGNRDIAGRTVHQIDPNGPESATPARRSQLHVQIVVLDDETVQDAIVQPDIPALANQVDSHQSAPLVVSSRAPRSMTASGRTASRKYGEWVVAMIWL